jgi:FtsP/CotA-like multicopper oxidase with cupredoxin domain
LATLPANHGAERGHVVIENTAWRAPLPAAVANDNRSAAGRLLNGVLTLQLETREVNWYPEDTTAPPIPVHAFAEAGRPAMIPGPMIRVPAGTEVRVNVRNTLSVPVRLLGFQDRGGASLDTVVVMSDSTRELRFRATVPGTYYYWGRTNPSSLPRAAVPVWGPGPGRRRDALLLGALIVDSARSRPLKNERVVVLSLWEDSLAALGVKSDAADRVLRRESVPRDVWFIGAMNGKSWPRTERLSYSVGDTIHWRVINGSLFPHPMHLHGFYFSVDSRGDANRDTVFPAAQRRQAVTEELRPGTTMGMTWTPTRPGNWLFHCHLVTHITELMRSPAYRESNVSHDNHAERGMSSIVMGVRVAPTKPMTTARDPVPRRRLRVFVTERANVFDDQPGYSYIVQDGPRPPAHDSIRVPSSPIVLRQNEPTAITVINAAKVTASIHWHGVELESFYDGVGGWSGWDSRVAPVIAPGDSFVVRLTPPRAGTFIYHAHTNEAIQLPSGLYGTLIVLPEKSAPDTTERVFLIGIGGPGENGRAVVNGSASPPSVPLRSGTSHRFRFINISPMESHTVQLLSGDTLQQWRALAKDGADLPTQQAILRPATIALHPGETYDYEVVRQRPESLTLRINSPGTIKDREAAISRGVPIPRIFTDIPIIVR